MKRLHVHLGVADLERSIRFYSALFAAEPSVRHSDYAKWQLDDPRVNFAISTRGKKAGLDHLGIQAEDDAELEQLGARLAQADVAVLPQKNASCCYVKSDKYWTLDPQGIAWESFHTLDTIPVFGDDSVSETQATTSKACCAPSLREPA
ncbi:MAG: ArsI/CadI family heavy metal resistance metalloenzyme [Burkholderiales bacterium]